MQIENITLQEIEKEIDRLRKIQSSKITPYNAETNKRTSAIVSALLEQTYFLAQGGRKHRALSFLTLANKMVERI